jgi:hypothetical protein
MDEFRIIVLSTVAVVAIEVMLTERIDMNSISHVHATLTLTISFLLL